MAFNFLQTWWPVISPYLPLAALLVAVLIPLSSAFFGAYTAQLIAERNRSRDDLTKEARNTNAALAVTLSVFNTAMALKRQHLLRFTQEFEQSKMGFIEHMRKREAGQLQANVVYGIQIPLMGLKPPKFAADSLRSMVLDRLSVVGRPLNLAVEIVECADKLTACIVGRNEYIDDMKAGPTGGLNENGSAQRFFGLKYGGGNQDLTYPNLLEAITQSADDVIFFAFLLCECCRRPKSDHLTG